MNMETMVELGEL